MRLGGCLHMYIVSGFQGCFLLRLVHSSIVLETFRSIITVVTAVTWVVFIILKIFVQNQNHFLGSYNKLARQVLGLHAWEGYIAQGMNDPFKVMPPECRGLAEMQALWPPCHTPSSSGVVQIHSPVHATFRGKSCCYLCQALESFPVFLICLQVALLSLLPTHTINHFYSYQGFLHNVVFEVHLHCRCRHLIVLFKEIRKEKLRGCQKMEREMAYNKLYKCITVPCSYHLWCHYKKGHIQRSEISPSNVAHIENTSANIPQSSVAESFAVIPAM